MASCGQPGFPFNQAIKFPAFPGLDEHPLFQNVRSSITHAQRELQGHWQNLTNHVAAATKHKHRRPPPAIIVPPRSACFAALIPGDSIVEQVTTSGLLNFLNLYNSALIVRLVLTWFPNPPAAIVNPLATVCDPYLNLFRGIIPPLGGSLDFSPILAFLLLNFLTSTASALPCEMGPDGKPVLPGRSNRGGAAVPSSLQPSKYEAAHQKRVQAARNNSAKQ